MRSPVNIAVLGSTGSIGGSTLDVVAASRGRLTVAALAARCRTEHVVDRRRSNFGHGKLWLPIPTRPAGKIGRRCRSETELLVGEDQLAKLSPARKFETVVAAIVGAAGLRSTWAALGSRQTRWRWRTKKRS